MIITFWRNFLGSRIRKPAWKQLQSVLSLGALLLVSALCADAQTTSSISGTVKDTTGAVIPGAKVVMINQASKARRSMDSNAEGFFYFAAVQPATYNIEISHQDFETWKVTGIAVHPGDNLTVAKIGLKVGAVAVSIVVTAEVAGVALSSGEHSTLITSAQIQRLSTVGRDAAELVSMLPGFAMTAGIDNKGPDYQTTGFGSGNLGAFGANGAAPQSGLVNIASDGANIIDAGDMGGQLANINMDQVEEVKVQTSNFGADVARGPIVVNAVGKSGGSDFHGSLYTYIRNYNLNSNDWVAKHLGTENPQSKYFYPGGTIGGPVLIPRTRFNMNKRLVFFTGYEYYGQHSFNSVVTAFVPNAAMMGGDLSADTLGHALGVNPTDLTTNCPQSYTQSETYSNIGGLCYSPTGGVGPNNHPISANGQIDPRDIDPAISAYTRFWPKANHTPRPVVSGTTTTAASEGFNYVKNVIDINNGFQSHSRVDLNISDSLKLYLTYNWEKVNYTTTMSSAYDYNVGSNNPLPTPFDSHTGSHFLTLNLTKVLGPSLTNELVVSGVKFNEPGQYEDRSKVLDTGTPWAAAGYSGGASPATLYGYGSTAERQTENQLPEMGFWEGGLPSFAAAYVPAKAQFLNKFTWSAQDNLTKVFKTHSIKVGFYADQTMENDMALGSNLNGRFEFMRWGGCYINQSLSVYAPINTAPNAPPLPGPVPANEPASAGTGNTVGQYLIGCPLSYTQDNLDPHSDLGDTAIEGYATDEWKVNSKLTVTFGIRLSHLTPWTDRHGIGLAVWDPSQLQQNVLYSSFSGDPATWKGFKWHKKDSDVPMAGVPTRALFYAPRFSLAYDSYGDGKTVFRGGFGVYHSHDSLFYAAGSSLPLGKQTWDMGSTGTGCDYAQLFGTSVLPCGYYTRSTVSSAMSPFSVSAQDPHDDRLPVIYNYNFTVDQSLPWKMQAELAYVGNQSSDLSTLGGLQNQNPVPLGALFGPDPAQGSPAYGQVNPVGSIPNSNDYRPYPNYQSINVPSHKAWANYNSMQASLNKQAGSLIFGLNYTWSKTLAVRGDWDTGAIADPVNMHNDYGIASFDRPHVINAYYSWQEGNKFHGNKILGGAINGWELSGITSWQAGPDLSVLNPGSGLGGTNYGLSGGATYYIPSSNGGSEKSVSIPINASTWLGSGDYALQPVLTCDPRSNLKKKQFVNGGCFAMPAQGAQGTWNLPFVSGPAFFKWDMTVVKHFKINDKQDVQIRLAGFNFLNHPITSFSSSDSTNPLLLNMENDSDSHYSSPEQALANVRVVNPNVFGITTFKQARRILELGFKYNF